MAELVLSKNVRGITGLEADNMGRLRPFKLYRKRGKKKRKVSLGLKGPERTIRREVLAQQAFADEYLRRHERSSGKKKNGFIRDLPDNLHKAYRKAAKKLYN